MGELTGISWADHTWNPWIGCTKVSPACDGCYAAALMGDQGRYKRVVWGEPGKGAGTRVETSSATFNAPLKWDRAARAAGVKRFVFVASLADIFDNEVPIEWLAKVFAMMRRTPNLIYLALTKRPQLIVKRFRAACPGEDWPENVFAGTTTEDQKRLDLNAPAILQAKAALGIPMVFLSMEPLLEGVNVRPYVGPADLPFLVAGSPLCRELPGAELCRRTGPHYPREFGCRWSDVDNGGAVGHVDWVITGGETDQGGHKARPTHPDWLRSIRDACAAAGVPYHHKQNGEWAPMDAAGIVEDCPVTDRWGNVRDWMHRYVVYADDAGAARVRGHSFTDHATNLVYRVGKKAAGRALDGVVHDAMPAVAA